MSFLHPNRDQPSSASKFILTIITVLVAYIFVGQIPLFVAYATADNQTLDIIKTLQDNYGLNKTFVLIMLPLIVLFFGLLLAVKYIHKWKVLSIFNNRPKIDFKRLILSFLLWFIISFIIVWIEFNDAFMWNFQLEKFVPLAILGLLIVPIQCAAEELFFRGYLLQSFGTKIKKGWIVVLVTGTLFGLLHAANPEVGQLGNVALIYYVWSGFFLGFLTLLDDGLEIPLGYHIANNLFATLIVTTDWQAFRTDALFLDQNPPSFTLELMLILLAGQLIFITVFSKIYGWKLKSLK